MIFELNEHKIRDDFSGNSLSVIGLLLSWNSGLIFIIAILKLFYCFHFLEIPFH